MCLHYNMENQSILSIYEREVDFFCWQLTRFFVWKLKKFDAYWREEQRAELMKCLSKKFSSKNVEWEEENKRKNVSSRFSYLSCIVHLLLNLSALFLTLTVNLWPFHRKFSVRPDVVVHSNFNLHAILTRHHEPQFFWTQSDSAKDQP